MAEKKIKIKKSTNNAHRSEWLITVNTNKIDTGTVWEDFQNAIDNIFSDSSLVGDFLVFEQGSWDDVVTTDIQYPEIEEAPNTNYVHCHFRFFVEHRARIKISNTAINKAFQDQLGYPVYVNHNLKKNFQKKTEDYAIKSRK